MGHRANFVVVRIGVPKAYFDQWAALGCLYGFEAGPENAVEMLNDYEPTTELMGWAFAEGGYLIDFDNRTAIVFGPEFDESEFDLNEFTEEPAKEEVKVFDAKKYLIELAPLWKGWTLIFDDRGVDAFAEYMHVNRIEGIDCQPSTHPANTRPPCQFRA